MSITPLLARVARMLGARHAYENRDPMYPDMEVYMAGYRGDPL